MHSLHYDPTRPWQSLLPEGCHISGMHVLSEHMLARTKIPDDAVMSDAVQRMGKQALHHALARCVKKITPADSPENEISFPGQITFRLDAYVLTPEELLAVVAAARCEGAYDEARWNRPQ
jgi:hypothetical protein